MAYVFRTRSKKTGKLHPSWRFQYTDWKGCRRTATGTTSRPETEKLAGKVQAEHDAIRRGYREAPKSSRKHRKRPLKEVTDEYLAWGNSQGGRGGRPWGSGHARVRKSHLK